MAGSLEELRTELPSSPYAAAKAASRVYAKMFHQLYDFRRNDAHLHDLWSGTVRKEGDTACDTAVFYKEIR